MTAISTAKTHGTPVGEDVPHVNLQDVSQREKDDDHGGNLSAAVACVSANIGESMINPRNLRCSPSTSRR